MSPWHLSSVYLMKFAVQYITVFDRALEYPPKYSKPSLLCPEPVLNTVLETKLISLIYVTHSKVVSIDNTWVVEWNFYIFTLIFVLDIPGLLDPLYTFASIADEVHGI